MRNILIVAGGVVAVAAIAAGVYFGTRPSSPGPAPQAVAQTADKTTLLRSSRPIMCWATPRRRSP